MLYCPDESQDCSGWSAIAPLDLQWKADEFVYSRFYLRKVETLDNPDTSLKQSMVCFNSIFEETADREVINTDGLHLLCRKIACSLLRDEDKILNEIIGLPAPGRISRLEENSLTVLKPVRTE